MGRKLPKQAVLEPLNLAKLQFKNRKKWMFD